MGMVCSTIASTAGMEAPAIEEEQMDLITAVVLKEIGVYTPKFSVAYCVILTEESKKRRKDQNHVELDLKTPEIIKFTEDAIKMANDKNFDATACTARIEGEEEQKHGLKDKIKEAAISAAEAALGGDDESDDEGDDDDEESSNVTTETVRDSVVAQLGSIRTDMIRKMGNVPEEIAERIVNAALEKATDHVIFQVLVQFAAIHIQEWNNIIKQKKNPKKVIKKGRKVCKSIQDTKTFKDYLGDFASVLQDSVVQEATKAKGAVTKAKEVKKKDSDSGQSCSF
jgi:hypothetical protein